MHPHATDEFKPNDVEDMISLSIGRSEARISVALNATMLGIDA